MGLGLDGLMGYVVDRIALTGEYGEFDIDVPRSIVRILCFIRECA